MTWNLGRRTRLQRDMIPNRAGPMEHAASSVGGFVVDKRGLIDLGDLRIIPYEVRPENRINSKQDFLSLNTKIERRLAYYNLPAFLLKLHDLPLENRELNEKLPFNAIAGIMSKYVLLNADIKFGRYPVFEEEILYFLDMILSCALYDSEFESKSEHGSNDFASLLLKKIGNQVVLNIQPHNFWGRTIYIYSELIESCNAPEFIRDVVTTKFKEKFGLSILDFIKLGYIAYSRSKRPGYMEKEYFEVARKQKIALPDDETVSNFLKQVSIDPLTYREKCIGDVSSLAYKLNPLFLYPLVRFPYIEAKTESQHDRFIAPVPDLLTYRSTTGLYHQLFNAFGTTKFSNSFGYIFERYVEKLLSWFQLSGKVLSERELITNARLNMKKGQNIMTPDFIILCNEGVILLECKATKYSQDIYEQGLDAHAKGCIDQLNKGITQLDSFEEFIPDICAAYDFTYQDLQIQKAIITFEELTAQNEGPLRNWMNVQQSNKTKCKIIWVYYMEEIQPYIAKGASLWSFLDNYLKVEFNKIISEMESKTGASYSDSMLWDYENKLRKELVKDAAYQELE